MVAEVIDNANQNDSDKVRHGTVRRYNSDLPHLESLSRIGSIPLIETSWNYAGDVYARIKRVNSLTTWGCETAEMSFNLAVENALPFAVSILGKGPFVVLDKVLCKSLDILDQRVPSLYLPPQMMYWNTKEYMNTKLVKPMMKRADSVKYLGNSVLTNKYAEYAANSLDNALNVADQYVEKYLPAESGAEDTDVQQTEIQDDNSTKAVKTIHHVDRFSRKLKRRLTRQAIAEAKALKQQSKEAIHVMFYVAELIATDPKLALKKAQELWVKLSQDEPENQARPATLEQLIVMITRETARRIVHLINHTSTRVSKLPNTINRTARSLTIQFLHVADSLLKTIHLEGVKNKAITEMKTQVEKIRAILEILNDFANQTLEQLALRVAGSSNDSSKKTIPTIVTHEKKVSSNRNKHSTCSKKTINRNIEHKANNNYNNSLAPPPSETDKSDNISNIE